MLNKGSKLLIKEKKFMGTGKTGGHWRPCNIGSVEAHNERRPNYLESVKKAGLSLYFFENLTEHNDHWVNDNVKYKDKTVADVFESMKKLYTEKVGQPPQLADKIKKSKKTGKEYKCAGWSPIREMVVPIKENTKLEDFDYLKKWAKNHGIEIMRIDLHKDEGYLDEETGQYSMNYHAHVVASFLDWNTGKTVKPNSQAMSEMQTILALALDMERGVMKKDTGAKYLNHQEYRQMKEEFNVLKNISKKLDEEILDKTNHLNNLNKEIKQAETKFKGLSTMLINIEAQKDNIEAQIAALEDEYAESNEQLELKRSELLAKLAEIEEKISDKTQKRKEAERKLIELAKEKNKLQEHYDELMREKVKIEPDVFEKVQNDVNATMWEEATREMKNDFSHIDDFLSKTLSQKQYEDYRELISGSMFEDLAQRGEEVAAVAAALYLGYIDQATTFARGSGGGGDSPGKGWGREKDEDDEAFRRRCCIMGRMMMKPASRKKQLKR